MSKKIDKAARNFLSALASLKKAASGPKSREVEIAGVIKMFEYTYETGWKMLKVMLEEQGIIAQSPRKVFVEAFTAGLIDDEKKWLAIIDDRNETSHTYKKSAAKKILSRIVKKHLPLFLKLKERSRKRPGVGRRRMIQTIARQSSFESRPEWDAKTRNPTPVGFLVLVSSAK